MTMERIGSSLYETLMRSGVRAKAVGAAEAHGISADAGGQCTGPAREGGQAPKGITISVGRVVRAWPRLIVIDGGKR